MPTSPVHCRQNEVLIHFSSNLCLSLSFGASIGQGSATLRGSGRISMWCIHGLSKAVFGAGLEAPGRAAGKRRGRELGVGRSPQQKHGTQLVKMDYDALWKPETLITELNTHQSSDLELKRKSGYGSLLRALLQASVGTQQISGSHGMAAASHPPSNLPGVSVFRPVLTERKQYN